MHHAAELSLLPLVLRRGKRSAALPHRERLRVKATAAANLSTGYRLRHQGGIHSPAGPIATAGRRQRYGVAAAAGFLSTERAGKQLQPER